MTNIRKCDVCKGEVRLCVCVCVCVCVRERERERGREEKRKRKREREFNTILVEDKAIDYFAPARP
jgi:hypothetical protein